MSDIPDNTYLREEYTSRINRVIDYIETNLDKELTLETLAQVANFSRFHFHRIFGAMMGETLNHFIQRLRIEKAATMLLNNPKKSITEIAFDCGFSGSAALSRVFKETYNMSPSTWRSGGYLQDRKNCQTVRNNDQSLRNIRKDFDVSFHYIDDTTFKQIWRIKMKGKSTLQAKVKVEDLSDMHVAYVRHVGPYKGDEKLFENLFSKLMKWAGPRDLLHFPDTKC